MTTYGKLKKAGVGFLRWLEVDFGGWAARRSINRKLHTRYLKNTPKMDEDYKREVEAFWKPYKVGFDQGWHRFYSQSTGIHDPRFIPDDIYFTIIDRYMNHRDLARGLKDKNNLPLLFPEIQHPKALVRRVNGQWLSHNHQVITEAEAHQCLNCGQGLIIKPSLQSGGGDGIEFWQPEEGFQVLLEKIAKVGDNLIVQDLIEQHADLARLHQGSVNTLRIMSFANHGRIHILSSVVRMGMGASQVDNAHAGGISAGILPNGQLKPVAYAEDGTRFESHPCGARFEDCTIANFQNLLERIQAMHGKLMHFRLVSWDIAIDKAGLPILVEANLYHGAIDLLQLNNGPLFGALTETVLQDVFGKHKER